MKYLFKNIKVLKGYFKGCEGKITYITEKYYMVDMIDLFPGNGQEFCSVLFEIDNLGKTYEIIEE